MSEQLPSFGKKLSQQSDESVARFRQIEAEDEFLEAVSRAIHLMDPADVEAMKTRVRVSSLYDRPKTPREVHKYVQLQFGVSIPWTACSEDMNAPFQWFYDVYTGRVQSSIAQGARGSGKTYYGSMMHYMWNTANPGISTKHAAANKKQAGVAQSYLANWSRDPVLGQVFDKNGLNKENAGWKNFAFWEIVTGTIAGVCLAAWASVITSEGPMPICQLVDRRKEVDVLTYNFETRQSEWKPVIGWHNHGKGGDFVKVEIAHKKTSVLPSMTTNHEVLMFDGSKKQAGQLCVGDQIAFLDYQPSDEQWQVLIGGMLGDASVGKEGRYSYAHGSEQTYYGDWKYQAFADLQQSRVEGKGGFGTVSTWYRFSKITHFTQMRDLWYPTNKKRVVRSELEKLAPLGLAVWFMDDGCCGTGHGGWTLYTNGFTYEEQEILQQYFQERWGWQCTIGKDKSSTWYLSFSRESSRSISALLTPYIETEGGGKRWIAKPIKQGEQGIQPMTVTAVTPVTLKDDTKYDITVADNHNFFLSSGQLVSNSGQHPEAATWDEIEFWSTDAIEQTWAVPVNRNPNVPGIWAGFSTLQRSYGAMYELIDTAAKRGLGMYIWSAFETMERCNTCVAIDEHPHGTDEQRCQSCVLWDDCKGVRGRRASGWIPRTEVCKLKRNMTLRSWQTQGLCIKPSSHGRVLHNFEHAYKPEGNYTKWVYYPDRTWFACYDPAEGKKSVIYFVQIDDDNNWYFFDEIVDSECPDATKAKLDFYEKWMSEGYGPPECVIIDPRRTDAGATWKRGSIVGAGVDRAYSVEYPPMDEASGGQEIVVTIEFLRGHIQNGAKVRRFFVNPDRCPNMVRGIKEYHYPTNINNEITSDKPAEEYKDEIDPLRYWAQWFKFRFHGRHSRIRVV